MQMSLDMAMDHTFTVGELGRLVGDVLSHAFPHDIWVQGEVRDMNRANSGHVYFTLVDPADEPGRPPSASLPVVLFESTNRTVNAQIKRSGGGVRIDDGVAVRVRGVPDFYPPSGKLSLRMTGIDPAYTLGLLTASRERLVQALRDDDLLDANRGLPTPMVPLRVGLITAANSAAHADFTDELRRSGFGFDLVLRSVSVQGAGAAAQVAAAVEAYRHTDVDVVTIVRGGGAKTDLSAFDDELVARAIASSRLPVMTGIGHEVDTAVADLVAHRAFKTPTACAAYLVSCVQDADTRFTATWDAIVERARAIGHTADQSLDTCATTARRRAGTALREADLRTAATARRVRDLTLTQVERSSYRLTSHLAAATLHARHRLDGAVAQTARQAKTLATTAQRHLERSAERVDRADTTARLLDPARALARGWSITTDEHGVAVRSVDDVQPGSTLLTRLADGVLHSDVTAAENVDAGDGDGEQPGPEEIR